MKKYYACTVFLFLSIIFFPAVSVYAGNDDYPKVQFEITSGVDLTKDVESTFDNSRTIAGTAENGTLVAIVVSHVNRDGELEELSNHNILVGATKIFSQNINLELGKNVIEIIAGKERRRTVVNVVVIKRKQQEIKFKLESDIVIPGNSILAQI